MLQIGKPARVVKSLLPQGEAWIGLVGIVQGSYPNAYPDKHGSHSYKLTFNDPIVPDGKKGVYFYGAELTKA